MTLTLTYTLTSVAARACTAVSAKSPGASSAYKTVRPQVTLCGSCFVKKSSATEYSHLPPPAVPARSVLARQPAARQDGARAATACALVRRAAQRQPGTSHAALVRTVFRSVEVHKSEGHEPCRQARPRVSLHGRRGPMDPCRLCHQCQSSGHPNRSFGQAQ